jgi:methyl-accepting chemotaxis protein
MPPTVTPTASKSSRREDITMKRYRDWKLTVKVLVPVGCALLAASLVGTALIYRQQTRQVHEQGAKMARALALQIAEDRSYYTTNVVGKLRADGLAIVPGDSRFHDVKGGIPLPATFVKEITESINKKGYYKVDLISSWPINKNKGPRTPFEHEVLAMLAKDMNTPRHMVESDHGQTRLVYVAADVASAQACVTCHNSHPDSPRKDFQLNDLMGALVVEVPLTAEIGAARSQAATIAGGIGVVILGVFALLGVIIRRFIQQPVATIIAGMERGGEDLTIRLPVAGDDEIGQVSAWFNRFMEKLQRIMHEVRQGALSVTTASRELSGAAEQLSQGAQKQASSLEQTAASLEEITGAVRQNADNARQADQLAGGARGVADQGGQVVGEAVGAMAEINRSSKKIADIIATIDEIAFQTNLLALNAAVEAARAGEQGRGFAVVAAEVRNLAQRTATAAKEIKGLIEDSLGKVEAGSELVNRSGATLQEIVGAVKRVTDVIGEIAAASKEQSTGIEQVNQAVAQMDEVVQANAAQTEEMSSTAQVLAEQAGRLQEMVGRFKVADGSSEGDKPAPASRLRPTLKPAVRIAPAPKLTRPAVTAATAPRAAAREEL